MQLNFTPEEEARLAQLAAKAGTYAEHLVKDIILNLPGAKVNSSTVMQFPVLYLGAVDPFRRRNIYTDTYCAGNCGLQCPGQCIAPIFRFLEICQESQIVSGANYHRSSSL